MKLIPISKDKFDEWKRMRKILYSTLSEEYHNIEILKIHEHSGWFCRFVVDDSQQIIGLVELSSRNIVDGCLSSPVAYLEGLYLNEIYRHKGYGKELMNNILHWCKENGFQELATDTELSNTQAQDFYKNMGFEEVDRIVEFCIDV